MRAVKVVRAVTSAVAAAAAVVAGTTRQMSG